MLYLAVEIAAFFKNGILDFDMPRNFNGHIFLAIIAISICAATVLSDEGRAMAESWPVLDGFRELELRGYVPLQPNVWPLRSGRMIAALPDSAVDSAARLWTGELRRCLESARVPQDTISFIVEPGIGGVFNDPRDPDDLLYPTLRLGGGMRKGVVEGFVTYKVNLRWAFEDNYRGRQWSGFAGRPDQVYLRVDDDEWGVQFGKDHISWGEGLVLGKSHASFDRIDYEFEAGKFRFAGFTGWLDAIQYSRQVGDERIYDLAFRYLSGHRLEFLSRHISVAMYEVILYGGVGRPFEAIYAVPFCWYHAEQLNRYLDDNTFIGGDFQVLFAPVRLSVEFMVDDLQVESQSQDDEEPPEIGFAAQADVGATIFDRWLTFTARYDAVTNWTYNQNNEWNRYLFMEKPLGSELGNDVDQIVAGAKFFASPKLSIGAKAFYKRKGEGRIDAPWSEPWLDIEGEYTEHFPTGVVERTTGVKINLGGNVWPFCFWDVDFEYGDVRNEGHEEGARSDYFRLGVSVNGSLYPSFNMN